MATPRTSNVCPFPPVHLPLGTPWAQSRDSSFHEQRTKGPPSLSSTSCRAPGTGKHQVPSRSEEPGAEPGRAEPGPARWAPAGVSPGVCLGTPATAVKAPAQQLPSATLCLQSRPAGRPAASLSPPRPDSAPHVDPTCGSGRGCHRRGGVPRWTPCGRGRGARVTGAAAPGGRGGAGTGRCLRTRSLTRSLTPRTRSLRSRGESNPRDFSSCPNQWKRA